MSQRWWQLCPKALALVSLSPVLTMQYLSDALRERLQLWHKKTLGLSDELIRFWWSWGKDFSFTLWIQIAQDALGKLPQILNKNVHLGWEMKWLNSVVSTINQELTEEISSGTWFWTEGMHWFDQIWPWSLLPLQRMFGYNKNLCT